MKSSAGQRKYFYHLFPNGKKKRPRKSLKNKNFKSTNNRLEIIENIYVEAFSLKSIQNHRLFANERFILNIYQNIHHLIKNYSFLPNEKLCLRIIQKSYDNIPFIIPIQKHLLGTTYHINNFQFLLTLHLWKRLIKRIKKNNNKKYSVTMDFFRKTYGTYDLL